MQETMLVKRYPIRGVSVGESYSHPPPPPPEVEHIRVGSYYETDSSIRLPEQLKSIRIVMVNKITGRHVSLRYPSTCSLRSYFDLNRTKPDNKILLPVMDEGYVMTAELAGELLYRRIPHHRVSLSRNTWSFWVSADSQPEANTLYRPISPEGKCWSELRSRGMVKWGKRFRVLYHNKESSRLVKEEDGDDGTLKRKVIDSRTDESLSKRAKVLFDQKKENQIVVYKRRSENNFIERWSVERYKLAEKNMLKVMKEKNAVFGNTMLRSELRSEARKLIGDTGLLDHLLKDMSGKVAPGGQDRFVRRHNADGAMEYWLESSDLVELRKEAGVEDLYWTPPLGWKLGDSPTQDPVCAGEIRDIRQVLASLKREMEKLTSTKEEEEELAIMTTPKSCVTTQNDMMTPANEMYADLLKKKCNIEGQLVIIAETLRKMEEEMGWLKKTVDENCPRMPDSTAMPFLLEDSPMMMKTQEGEVKENQFTESPQKARKDNRLDQRSPLSLIHNTGFRVCRPVASFSWPKLPGLVAATDSDEFASLPSYRPSPSLPRCPVLPSPFTVRSPETPTNLFNL